MSGRWLRMAPAGQLDAVADDVVLVGLDRQRVLRLERLEPALRHRERVVAEVDLAGLLVPLVHREVDDPAEPVGVLLDQIELLAQLDADPAGQPLGGRALVARRRTPRRRRRRRSPRAGGPAAARPGTSRSGPWPRPRPARCSRAPARPASRAHWFSLSKKLRGWAAAPAAPARRARPRPCSMAVANDREARAAEHVGRRRLITSGLRRSGLSLP